MNLVDPLQIGTGISPNTYLPLVPGSIWTYVASFLDDEGETVTETFEVSVTSEIKQIEGVTCVTVREIVREDGDLIEDTDGWFAQDIGLMLEVDDEGNRVELMSCSRL